MKQGQKRQLPELRRGLISQHLSEEEKELYADDLPKQVTQSEEANSQEGEVAKLGKSEATPKKIKSTAGIPSKKAKIQGSSEEGTTEPKSKKTQVMVYFDDNARMIFERMLMEGAFVTLQKKKVKLQQSELVVLMTNHFYTLFEKDRAKFDSLCLGMVDTRR